MEPFLLLVDSLWWAGPAAGGLGAATYGVVTTRGRRARRLELDAARHQESEAYRALVHARAGVRAAQAEVLSARAQSGFPGSAAVWEAKRLAQEAKRVEKSAALELRASRARVKATSQRMAAAGARAPLPIERVFAVHDAVNLRFGEYQTDPERVIAYPLMADTQHPATVTFLRAQREAQHLRPSSAQAKITPTEFLAYRDAVRALEFAFDAAERAAQMQMGPTLDGRRPTWPVPRRDGSP